MKPQMLTRVVLLASAVLGGIAVGFPMAQMHAAKNGAVRPHPKAVAFDYFVLFNPDSVVDDVEQMFPGKGREFTTWHSRPMAGAAFWIAIFTSDRGQTPSTRSAGFMNRALR